MKPDTATLLKGHSVIPVLVIDNPDDAVPLARTLVDNGLHAVEVTLRTSHALEAMRRIRTEVPDCILGAGTILTPEDLQAVIGLGVAFGVSPGMSAKLLQALDGCDLPFLPGVSTLSEILHLREHGYLRQKLFPAGLSGGPAFLKSVSGPVQDVGFCPTGGINLKLLPDYLALKNVFALGGTWIAPADLVRAQQWQEIGQRARFAAEAAQGATKGWEQAA